MLVHETLLECHQSIIQDESQLLSNLDTTMDYSNSSAFEGPEKLLEVWFAPAPDALPLGVKENGLKAVHIETWKDMLNLVNCKILSVVESEHLNAYLLSESSMFVFPHKLILKTCGTTTLLFGLSRILSIASLDAGFPQNPKTMAGEVCAIPYRVFYSRKKFLFPDKQQGPHRCWEKEVEFLDGIFEGGSAYMVGKMNGDHWYLYLTPPNTSTLSSSFHQGRNNNDETLEILMSDLDQDNAKQFFVDYAVNNLNGLIRHMESLEQSNKTQLGINQDNEKISLCSQPSHSGFLTPPTETLDCAEIAQGHVLGTIVTETCGLLKVFPLSKYPNAKVDSYLFSPCGLSVNGVVPAPDDTSAYYYTVHVTPEAHCSYASFESNVPIRHTGRDTAHVVEQVVNIFKPGRFSVTLFEAKSESYQELYSLNHLKDNGRGEVQFKKNKCLDLDEIEGYQRSDRIIHEFEGYKLVFRYYEREVV